MYRGNDHLRVDILTEENPPEDHARKDFTGDLIGVKTDGTLTKVVTVRLVNNTSFLATRINDPILSSKEQSSPLISFFSHRQVLSFTDTVGKEHIVPLISVVEIC